MLPENTYGRSSPPGAPIASPSGSSLALFRTGTASPVSSDSSAAMFIAHISAMSAGTRSPSASSTTSPRTTSRPGTTTRFPPRNTVARGADSPFSASSARSVFRSWKIVIPMMKNTNADSIPPSA